MRKLNTGDVFAVARLTKKLDAKNAFMEAWEATKKDGKENVEERGISLLFSLIYSAGDPAAEKDFYIILADIAEKKPDEIKKQSFQDTINDLKAIAAENDLKSFFTTVKQLIPKLN